MVAKTLIFGPAFVILLAAINWYALSRQTGNKAWMTLLTNEKYLEGVITLEYSIRKFGSRYPLVVFHPETLEQSALDALHKRNIKTTRVNLLLPAIHKDYGTDQRFYDCWSKLLPHGMVEYQRIVELDADMLLRGNVDELMDLELPQGTMAATHACVCNPNKISHYPEDWIPENCAYTEQAEHPETAHLLSHTVDANFGLSIMNGGLQVINPNKKHFNDIVDMLANATLTETFAFADQSLLSHYFKDRWVPLPYSYNALKTMKAAHPEIWTDEQAKIVHYILNDKPWHDLQKENSDFLPNVWWWKINNERLAAEKMSQIKEYIDHVIANNKVVLFSKTYCPHCRAAKSLLTEQTAAFELMELDLLEDGQLIQEYLHSRNGIRTVPQLFVRGSFVGGNSDLQRMKRSNALESLFD